MTGFRVWLRDSVFNFLRDPERKTNAQKRNNFRKSLLISAPIPLGSIDVDFDTKPLPLPPSRSLQDVTDPYPTLRRSQYVSADQILSQPIDMIAEDDETPSGEGMTRTMTRTHTPPPNHILTSRTAAAPKPAEPSPTRRPMVTRNFSRRFSRRYSSHSSHSASSYSDPDSKRSSHASAFSTPDEASIHDEWMENKLNRRWSQRMSGALESYQTHARNYTPTGVI